MRRVRIGERESVRLKRKPHSPRALVTVWFLSLPTPGHGAADATLNGKVRLMHTVSVAAVAVRPSVCTLKVSSALWAFSGLIG